MSQEIPSDWTCTSLFCCKPTKFANNALYLCIEALFKRSFRISSVGVHQHAASRHGKSRSLVHSLFRWAQILCCIVFRNVDSAILNAPTYSGVLCEFCDPCRLWAHCRLWFHAYSLHCSWEIPSFPTIQKDASNFVELMGSLAPFLLHCTLSVLHRQQQLHCVSLQMVAPTLNLTTSVLHTKCKYGGPPWTKVQPNMWRSIGVCACVCVCVFALWYSGKLSKVSLQGKACNDKGDISNPTKLTDKSFDRNTVDT